MSCTGHFSLCYICNHSPVPEIDPEKYELKVDIEGTPYTTLFTLEDLKQMPPKTIIATMQCAENRSIEMAQKMEKSIQRLSRNHNAICNAVWKGVLLLDILKAAGFDEKDEQNQHIQFESVKGPAGSFSTSIPLWRMMNEKCDVILAYEMNGEPLSRDHGFPVRVIIPGVTGSRWVKWLDKITLQKSECESDWFTHQFVLPNIESLHNFDSSTLEESPSIQEMPVTSAICSPVHNEKIELKAGKLQVEGYAWSGGGKKVTRVDVSIDKGKTWIPAKISCEEQRAPPYHWSWALWSVSIPIEKGIKYVEVWSKATDSACNTQPEKTEWNLTGVCCNAVHKVRTFFVW